LGVSSLTQSLQGFVQQLQADRGTLGATQLLLDLCQSGDRSGS
jgi:hypothetical protein